MGTSRDSWMRWPKVAFWYQQCPLEMLPYPFLQKQKILAGYHFQYMVLCQRQCEYKPEVNKDPSAPCILDLNYLNSCTPHTLHQVSVSKVWRSPVCFLSTLLPRFLWNRRATKSRELSSHPPTGGISLSPGSKGEPVTPSFSNYLGPG